MIAWFVHGWGFGPSTWDALAARLPAFEPRFADRGYFGGGGAPVPKEPAIWIAHSFGTMLALRSMSARCRALVAINGFDRFVADEAGAGIAPRVIERMISRFEQEPLQVVSDFRRKCGNDGQVDHIEPDPLRRDLLALRDGDARAEAAELTIPVLLLQAAADPILPAEMRVRTLQAIPGARHALHPSAGHLLPSQDPEWCARQIGTFAAETGL